MGTRGKRFVAGVMALFLSVSMTGCGAIVKTVVESAQDGGIGAVSEESSLKEFKSRDGSVSIQMSKEWELQEDEGDLDSWIKAYAPDDSEGMQILQVPMTMTLQLGVDNMIMAFEAGLELSEINTGAITDLEIPGVLIRKTYTARMRDDSSDYEVCFVYGNSDYAIYQFIYIPDKLDDSALEYFKACCATFREELPEVESNDTMRWLNAASAILMAADGYDYNLFDGLSPTDADVMGMQELLEALDITDKETAMSELESFLTEGLRVPYRDMMKAFDEMGLGDIEADERAAYLYRNANLTKEEGEHFAFFYNAYRDDGITIDAWDYSYAMSLYGWCCIAGYYTKEEALDGALALAEQIRNSYESWNDFAASCQLGDIYMQYAMSEGSEEINATYDGISEEDRALYEEIKAMTDSIYDLDWNTPLEKSW